MHYPSFTNHSTPETYPTEFVAHDGSPLRFQQQLFQLYTPVTPSNDVVDLNPGHLFSQNFILDRKRTPNSYMDSTDPVSPTFNDLGKGYGDVLPHLEGSSYAQYLSRLEDVYNDDLLVYDQLQREISLMGILVHGEHPSPNELKLAIQETVPEANCAPIVNYEGSFQIEEQGRFSGEVFLGHETSISETLRNDKLAWDFIQKNKKKGTYKCTHCSDSFITLMDFAKHIDRYGIKRQHKCPILECPWKVIGFTRQPELRRHCRSQHAICWDSTRSRDALTKGEIPKLRDLRHGCTVTHCGNTFKRRDLLQRHIRLVHENPESRFNIRMEKMLQRGRP
ncbi:hypothetical protein BABINDRAFT_10701 [Babjeviella inositovora NRRL Y-12698]|uniref:C2H2-type domain-containing protein n=1 Tax=Babjeviella inositovora NRRL Y-12698 TaxID=984486 RepID=A0A1E3QX22_9ASCO|nr:uncharacterized protein BABINDRAFT_10701 [Babjeviella inositovora NRRL Y-12698]ODQ82235.1 hypothetical protein BABINDRAFT_10701 [Babjeviella inositovora NRRL Y-12698]